MGQVFESPRSDHSVLTQSEECEAVNLKVRGSKPRDGDQAPIAQG
jgi:hypothetical protein